MFIRAPNSGRKLLLTCIVAGVMIAILVSCLQFLVAWHKHEVKYDTLRGQLEQNVHARFIGLRGFHWGFLVTFCIKCSGSHASNILILTADFHVSTW